MNGHGIKRVVLWAILYARVSTDEQARSGYSLAQRLEALRNQQEALEALELDRDVLLERYAAIAPEALDSLIPEERHRLYKLLRITVIVQPDTTLEISGVFGEKLSVSNQGLVSGLQEDLTRHLARALPAGVILGESPDPSS